MKMKIRIIYVRNYFFILINLSINENHNKFLKFILKYYIYIFMALNMRFLLE